MQFTGARMVGYALRFKPYPQTMAREWHIKREKDIKVLDTDNDDNKHNRR